MALAANALYRQKDGCATRIFDEDIKNYLVAYENDITSRGWDKGSTSDLAEVIKKARSE